MWWPFREQGSQSGRLTEVGWGVCPTKKGRWEWRNSNKCKEVEEESRKKGIGIVIVVELWKTNNRVIFTIMALHWARKTIAMIQMQRRHQLKDIVKNMAHHRLLYQEKASVQIYLKIVSVPLQYHAQNPGKISCLFCYKISLLKSVQH